MVIVNIMDAALKWKQKENCKKVHRILTEYRGRKVDVKLKKRVQYDNCLEYFECWNLNDDAIHNEYTERNRMPER